LFPAKSLSYNLISRRAGPAAGEKKRATKRLLGDFVVSGLRLQTAEEKGEPRTYKPSFVDEFGPLSGLAAVTDGAV
jgi:hypothetical protein